MTRWIDLDGAANVRDLGDVPVGPGRRIRPNRLLRSDNLQGLSDDDVRRLIDEHGLRSIADLRTSLEVEREGPGPLVAEPSVALHHLSLLPEAGVATDVAAGGESATNDGATDVPASDVAALLPWQDKADERNQVSARTVYLRYLQERPDSIVAALRLIAATGAAGGATIVHCAAGKDRTGVVVAFALAEIGVDRAAILDDYLATDERIPGIIARLAASPTYNYDIDPTQLDRHRPRRETFEGFLADLDELGGARGWLREHGWTEDDAEQLRTALLEPSDEGGFMTASRTTA